MFNPTNSKPYEIMMISDLDWIPFFLAIVIGKLQGSSIYSYIYFVCISNKHVALYKTSKKPHNKSIIKLSLYKKNNKSNNHLELEQLSTNNATIAGPPSTTNNPLEDHQETLLHDPEDFYRSLSIWIGIILV